MTKRDFERLKRTESNDNSDPSGKLYLRRYFLDKYHKDAPSTVVLDCCQAEARLWSELRREYKVKYWGVDRTVKRGRMSIDSARLLAVAGLPYDVIDVDTYGAPWAHWETLLPHLVKPATVFLTLGRLNITAIESVSVAAVGLSKMKMTVPHTLLGRLRNLAVDACLARCYIYGVQIVEAQEVMPPSSNARYFGLRLSPSTRAS